MDWRNRLRINHETGADFVHLDHRRAAVGIHGRLHFIDALIIGTLEHGFDFNLILRLIEIRYELVDRLAQFPAHGVPPDYLGLGVTACRCALSLRLRFGSGVR
ncbi:hypothetical protein D3C71_1473080 [compost metagenome]